MPTDNRDEESATSDSLPSRISTSAPEKGDEQLSDESLSSALATANACAFNRAFRRWHHETPQAFRKRRRNEPVRVAVSRQ